MTKNLDEAQLELALKRRSILLTMLQRRELPREPAPFNADDIYGRLFWSPGHRPGADCPKCARSR